MRVVFNDGCYDRLEADRPLCFEVPTQMKPDRVTLTRYLRDNLLMGLRESMEKADWMLANNQWPNLPERGYRLDRPVDFDPIDWPQHPPLLMHIPLEDYGDYDCDDWIPRVWPVSLEWLNGTR